MTSLLQLTSRLSVKDGLPVSGFKSVQPFGLAQNIHANALVGQRWTRPIGSEPIVKLLFTVAEPVQMGLQVTFAIVTLTGLLYNYFRTRSIIHKLHNSISINRPNRDQLALYLYMKTY